MKNHPGPQFEAFVKPLVMLLVAPLALVLTLFWLLGQGLHGYSVVVANQDAGTEVPVLGRLSVPLVFTNALAKQGFAISEAATPEEAQARYASGAAKILLVFPPQFSADLMARKAQPDHPFSGRIRLELAETNPLARLLALAAIAKSVAGAIPAGAQSGLSLDALPLPLELKPLLEGFAPAVSYLFLAFMAFLSWVLTGAFARHSALAIAAKGIVPTGSGAYAFQAGFIMAFAGAGWLLYLGLSGFGSLVLNISLPDAWLPGSAVVALLLMVASSLVFAVVQQAANPEQSRLLFAALILPLFFSGFLFPIELLPSWLQWLQYLFVPCYAIPAALGVQLGVDPVWGLGVTAGVFGTLGWLAAFVLLGFLGLHFRKARA